MSIATAGKANFQRIKLNLNLVNPQELIFERKIQRSKQARSKENESSGLLCFGQTVGNQKGGNKIQLFAKENQKGRGTVFKLDVFIFNK